MLKLTDLSEIMRIDFEIEKRYCNSDGEPVVIDNSMNLSAIYNKSIISENEVKEWIDKNPFKHHDKILILKTEIADTVLKNIFLVKDFGFYIGLESDQNQERLAPEDKNKLHNYDVMKVFKTETDAMTYRDENPENRDYKYVYVKAPKQEVDYESV